MDTDMTLTLSRGGAGGVATFGPGGRDALVRGAGGIKAMSRDKLLSKPLSEIVSMGTLIVCFHWAHKVWTQWASRSPSHSQAV
eukprot:358990-Chlamydomonas_euryale.AAC.1